MPLRVMNIPNSQVAKIIGIDTEPTDEQVREVLWSFGSIGMNVGYSQLTDENLHLWLARLKILQMLYGPFLMGADGPKPVGVEWLKAYVGGKLNVPDISEAAWRKDVFQRVVDAAKREIAEYNQKIVDKVLADEIPTP